MPGVPIPADTVLVLALLLAPIAVHVPRVAPDVLHGAMLAMLVILGHSGRTRRKQRGGDKERKFAHFLSPFEPWSLLFATDLQ